MSCKILLIMLLLISSFNIYSQIPEWRALQEPAPDTNIYSFFEDVYFQHTSLGWAAKLNGKIYRTTNSGKNWTLIFNDTSKYFYRNIKFFDELNGWCSTSKTSVNLYKTTNGGVNWIDVNNIQLQPPVSLETLCLIDDLTVYAGGSAYFGPQFVRTSNSGLNWSVINLSSQLSGLSDLFFINRDSGFAAGCIGIPFTNSKGVILFTSNGGQNWVNRHTTSITGVNAWQIYFNKDLSFGGVILESTNSPAYFLKTTDIGKNWQEMIFTNTSYLSQTLGFKNNLIGWIGGSGLTNAPVYYTTNGGTSFDTARWGRCLRRIIFINDTLGFAAGHNIYRYSITPIGIKITSNRIPVDYKLNQNYPNPFNPQTTITFDIPASSVVEISIFDILGRLIENPVNQIKLNAGKYEYRWNAENLPSGVYFCKLNAGNFTNTIKMILLK